MKNTIKKMIYVIIFGVISLNVFAEDITNDASAFITRSEYEVLKNKYQSKLQDYNRNLDDVIDQAISKYISTSLKTEIPETGWELLWTEEEFNTKLCQPRRFDTAYIYNGASGYDIELNWNINSYEAISIEKKEDGEYIGGEYRYEIFNPNYYAYYTVEVAQTDNLDPGDTYYPDEFFNKIFTNEWQPQITSMFDPIFTNLISNPSNYSEYDDFIEELRNTYFQIVSPSGLFYYTKIKIELHLHKINDINEVDWNWKSNWGFSPIDTTIGFCYDKGLTTNYYMIPDKTGYVGGSEKIHNVDSVEAYNYGYLTYAIGPSASAGEYYDREAIKNEYANAIGNMDFNTQLSNIFKDVCQEMLSRNELENVIIDLFTNRNSYFGINWNSILEFHISDFPYINDSWWEYHYKFVPPGVLVIELQSTSDISVNVFSGKTVEEKEEVFFGALDIHPFYDYYEEDGYVTLESGGGLITRNDMDSLMQYYNDILEYNVFTEELTRLGKDLVENIYYPYEFENLLRQAVEDKLSGLEPNYPCHKYRLKFHINKPSDYFAGSAGSRRKWCERWGISPPCTITFDMLGSTLIEYKAEGPTMIDSDGYCGLGNKYISNTYPYEQYGYASIALKSPGDSSARLLEYYTNLLDDGDTFSNFMEDFFLSFVKGEYTKNDLEYYIYTELVNYLPQTTASAFNAMVNPIKIKFKIDHSIATNYDGKGGDWWRENWNCNFPCTIIIDCAAQAITNVAVIENDYLDQNSENIDEKKYDVEYGYKRYKKSMEITNSTYATPFLLEEIDGDSFYLQGKAAKAYIENNIKIDFSPIYDFSDKKYWFNKKEFDKMDTPLELTESGVYTFPEIDGRLEFSNSHERRFQQDDTYASVDGDYVTFHANTFASTDTLKCILKDDELMSYTVYNTKRNILRSGEDVEGRGEYYFEMGDRIPYEMYNDELKNYLVDTYGEEQEYWPRRIRNSARLAKDKYGTYYYMPYFEYASAEPDTGDPAWVYVQGSHFTKGLQEYVDDENKIFLGEIKIPLYGYKVYDIPVSKIYSKGLSTKMGYKVPIDAGIPIAKTDTAQTDSTLKFKFHIRYVTNGAEWTYNGVNIPCYVSDKPFLNGQLDPSATVYANGINININDAQNVCAEIPNITCPANTTLWINFGNLVGSAVPAGSNVCFFMSDVSIE